MLDAGTSGTTPGLDFSDRDDFDAMAGYTVAFKVQPNQATWTSGSVLVGKFATGNNGWAVRQALDTTNNRIQVIHGTSAVTDTVNSDTNLSSGTTYSFVVTVTSGDVVAFSLDGSSDGGATLTESAQATAEEIKLLNRHDFAQAAEAAVGQVMIWPDVVLGADDITKYHAGAIIPQPTKLGFWHKGVSVPGIDEIAQEIPTESGTVNLLEDPVDNMFGSNLIDEFVHLGTLRLISLSSEVPVYSIKVPWRFLGLENMDLANISHDQLIRSESMLTDIGDHMLIENWRRLVTRVVGMTFLPAERAVRLQLRDWEATAMTFFSTDRAEFGTVDNLDTVARLDYGGSLAVVRSHNAYVEQDNDIVPAQSLGVNYHKVSPGVEKIGPKGLIAEDSVVNLVLHSDFGSGLTGWTSVTNSGTNTADTTRLVFNDTNSQSIRSTRADDANDTYIHQTIAVLSADTERRLYFIHTEPDATSVGTWAVQRSTDSQWWNDSSEAWGASKTWNTLTNNYDTAASVERQEMAFSNPIDVDTNENWEIQYGIDGSAQPASGGTTNIYYVGSTIGRYIYTPIRTDGTSETTDDEEIKITLDSSGDFPTVVEAIDWTGASTDMSDAALTGVADGKKGTVVAWVRLDGSNATLMTLITNDNRRVEISRTAGNLFRLLLENSAGTQLVDASTTTSYTSGATWLCLMFSWDLTTSGSELLKMYVGDTDDTPSAPATLTAGTVMYSEANWGFAADVDASRPFDGSTGPFWFSFAEYIDFDLEENRRLFYSSDGNVVDVGTDGKKPTGRQPELLFMGDNTEYHISKGFANDTWTVTGSPGNASSEPTAHVPLYRQLVYAGRGTLSFRMVAEQDAANMQDTDILCLYYWQYGSTSNYDAVYYEKPTAAAARFVFTRYTGGVQRQEATLVKDIVRGTEYRIVARWTSPSDGELGEAANTFSIFVAESPFTSATKGTDDNDATANGDQDTTATATELWKGSAPSGTGYKRCMNWLSFPRFQSRVVTDEEVPSL